MVIHILLFLLYKPLAGISGLMDFAKAEDIADEPLTFELVDPYQEPQELVETPEDARIDAAPEDARFLSDKNARAQDMLDNDVVPDGLSFSEGISEFKTFAGGGPLGDPNMSQQEQPLYQEEINGETERGNDEYIQDGEQYPYRTGEVPLLSQSLISQQKKFSKEVLRGTTNPASPFANTFSDDADWDNQQSNAEALGGISLSTYQWDYAPYLLYMKRRIREHLYPPTAFVQMGAISGDVTISFVLRRDGAVRDLKLIGNRGHNSFIDPSLNSIKASAPFKPLPDDFPEPYLELTWTFVYTVYR
ncbi:hypothetical protein EH223_11940 [candidate division KSB1 bacterium]|nr:energy transducer TonB [candidate division KSB1 bacterium]RQW02707.1 MAG: hypothetical protein EH223_11940 [candidate division KSB1 bacterium]